MGVNSIKYAIIQKALALSIEECGMQKSQIESRHIQCIHLICMYVWMDGWTDLKVRKNYEVNHCTYNVINVPFLPTPALQSTMRLVLL